MKLLARLMCLIICTAPLEVFAAPQGTPFVTLSGHVASFLPQSGRFQRIYGNSIPIYGAGLNFQWDPSWELWTSFEGYSKSSHICSGEAYTSITNFSFSMGPNFHLHPFSNFDVSIGLGPVFGAISLENQSWCEQSKSKAFVIGGAIRLNLRCWVHPRAFITLFSDYSYQHSFLDNNVNVGGTKLGGGMGWKI